MKFRVLSTLFCVALWASPALAEMLRDVSQADSVEKDDAAYWSRFLRGNSQMSMNPSPTPRPTTTLQPSVVPSSTPTALPVSALERRFTNVYDTIFNFRIDGHWDWAVFQPRLFDSEYRISHVAAGGSKELNGGKNNLKEPKNPTVVVSLSDDTIGIYDPTDRFTVGAPLAKPLSMTCKWAEAFTLNLPNEADDDGTTETKVYTDGDPFKSSTAGAVWRVTCPDGYVALSDVASRPKWKDVLDSLHDECKGKTVNPGDEYYPDETFMCVNKDLTKPVPLQNDIYPSNCAWETNVYPTTADAFFVGKCNNDSDRPNEMQFALGSAPRNYYRDATDVLTLNNPTDMDQEMEFQLQKGLELQSSSEESVSSETRVDFSVAVSKGVKGAVSFEATASFGATWATSRTVTSSDIQSTIQTSTISIVVPAKSRAALKQLVIVDSPSGISSSDLVLFTSHFTIDITSLGNETVVDQFRMRF